MSSMCILIAMNFFLENAFRFIIRNPLMYLTNHHIDVFYSLLMYRWKGSFKFNNIKEKENVFINQGMINRKLIVKI